MRNIAIRIIAVLALAICALAQPEQQQATSTEALCRSFVQRFYDWYVPLALKDDVWRAWDVAVRNKPEAFTPQLTRLVRQDTAAQRKASELVGLDFDPFLASQDPSEKFVVESVTCKAATCWVKVQGISSGIKRETVLPEVECRNGRCRFINFHYEKPATDLLTVLKLNR